MAVIHGKIDSLKQIRSTLNHRGIKRFNSINQINNFLENYKSEELQLYNRYENELEKDIVELQERIHENKVVKYTVENETREKLDEKIDLNLRSIYNINKKNKNSFLAKYFDVFKLKLLNKRVRHLQKNYDSIIGNSISEVERSLNRDQTILNTYINHKEDAILTRSAKDVKRLEYTKEVLLEINPLIAGAIGENLVVKEIEKLSDDYILINDFSLQLDTPIYYKKDNTRIHSIQIDHLLISKAGIFILETKNWSKKSIQSSKLWSPVEQISRSRYALFVLLSRKNIKLKNHFWGENKQIPLRSIIVMINEKPKEEFKFVKIKTLKELSGYIEYFDPIFNDHELNKIHREIICMS